MKVGKNKRKIGKFGRVEEEKERLRTKNGKEEKYEELKSSC